MLWCVNIATIQNRIGGKGNFELGDEIIIFENIKYLLQCFSFAFLLLSVVFHDLSNDLSIF
jgi:hypothetical protein